MQVLFSRLRKFFSPPLCGTTEERRRRHDHADIRHPAAHGPGCGSRARPAPPVASLARAISAPKPRIRWDASKPQHRGYGLKKCKKTSFGNGPPKCKWFFRSSFFFFGQALQNKNPRHKAGDCCCISGRWEVCLAHPAALPFMRPCRPSL